MARRTAILVTIVLIALSLGIYAALIARGTPAGYPLAATPATSPPSCPEISLSTFIETAQESRMEWMNTWLGVPLYQFPTDLLTYQELIVETRPDVIVEMGTAIGGLAVFLASVFDNLDSPGTVITVDINADGWKSTAARPIKESIKNRITFIHGDSISDLVAHTISEKVGDRRAMLILDSAHHRAHVRSELERYSSLIQVGGYIVVNDTHLDGTAEVGFRAGPRTAVDEFVTAHPEFIVDNTKQRFAISCFHYGVLKRVR